MPAWLQVLMKKYSGCTHLNWKKDAAWILIKSADAVLVPGGFGERGTEGKMMAINYARENNVPYLGLCLGMQLMVVEFAREVLG